MGRFTHHLNTVLNFIFVAAAAALVVLGILSLTGGPTLRFAPYMAGVGCIYYLGMAVKLWRQGERKRFVKGLLLLLLALLCGVSAYFAYRCLV